MRNLFFIRFSLANKKRGAMKIIAIIILSFFTLVADSAFAETITVSNVGSPVSLMYHEVLKKAYEKIGIELKRKIYPGKRALKYANAGKTSGGVRIKGIEKNYPNGRMYSLGEVNFIQGMHDFGNPKNSVVQQGRNNAPVLPSIDSSMQNLGKAMTAWG